MAENEYLGVGYSSAYRKTRRLIQNESSSTDEIGECAAEDLLRRLLRNLRRSEPLKEIIDALPDRGKLRAVIEASSDPTLARYVRDVCTGGHFTQVEDIAGHVAQRLIDGVRDSTLHEADKYDHNRMQGRYSKLCSDVEICLEQVRIPIANAIAKSLRGIKPLRIPRSKIRIPHLEPGASLVNRSLISRPSVKGNVNPNR